MRTLKCLSAIFAVLMIFAVVPAMAGVYTVHLKNGSTFETRYQPLEADWDDSRIVFLTEVGNRITFLKDDIAEISSETDVKGFGTMIDTTTIVLGWAPNDAPLPGEQVNDPRAEWMNFLEQQSEQRNYSVEQFVEPSEAGQGGGLPSWEFGSGATGGGGPGVIPVPPLGRGPALGPTPVPLPAGPPSADDGGS